MVDNILNKIINKKKQRLTELKKTVSIESLDKLLDITDNISFLNFKKKLKTIL